MGVDEIARWMFKIFFTIFLGALGSGLWSFIFDPILRKIGNKIVVFSFFGLKKLENKIYEKIAFGSFERSYFLLMFLFCILLTAPVVFLFSLEGRNERIEKDYRMAIGIVKGKLDQGENDFSQVEEIRHEITKERADKARLLVVSLSVILVVIIFLQTLKFYFIEYYIHRFNRYINVCLPYFEKNEKEILLSRFSLMGSAKEYSEIMECLRLIAERGNIELKRPNS